MSHNLIKTKQETDVPRYRIFSKTAMFQDYRACPHCGQNEIPFKKGVCPKCSKQIGDVQYVKDPQEYVKSNYGNIWIRLEKVYQGFDEL
ncbi:MAG: hypothetical protein OEL84_09605 [Nitrosopumilus sp.]|nr:hypothetical protein [Nitrosopumilus sp.]MDH3341518.1 hypothetical protein [Nitrosopumilus sp.]